MSNLPEYLLDIIRQQNAGVTPRPSPQETEAENAMSVPVKAEAEEHTRAVVQELSAPTNTSSGSGMGTTSGGEKFLDPQIGENLKGPAIEQSASLGSLLNAVDVAERAVLNGMNDVNQAGQNLNSVGEQVSENAGDVESTKNAVTDATVDFNESVRSDEFTAQKGLRDQIDGLAAENREISARQSQLQAAYDNLASYSDPNAPLGKKVLGFFFAGPIEREMADLARKSKDLSTMHTVNTQMVTEQSSIATAAAALWTEEELKYQETLDKTRAAVDKATNAADRLKTLQETASTTYDISKQSWTMLSKKYDFATADVDTALRIINTAMQWEQQQFYMGQAKQDKDRRDHMKQILQQANTERGATPTDAILDGQIDDLIAGRGLDNPIYQRYFEIVRQSDVLTRAEDNFERTAAFTRTTSDNSVIAQAERGAVDAFLSQVYNAGAQAELEDLRARKEAGEFFGQDKQYAEAEKAIMQKILTPDQFSQLDSNGRAQFNTWYENEWKDPVTIASSTDRFVQSPAGLVQNSQLKPEQRDLIGKHMPGYENHGAMNSKEEVEEMFLGLVQSAAKTSDEELTEMLDAVYQMGMQVHLQAKAALGKEKDHTIVPSWNIDLTTNRGSFWKKLTGQFPQDIKGQVDILDYDGLRTLRTQLVVSRKMKEDTNARWKADPSRHAF